MRSAVIILVLAGATACGAAANTPQPKAPMAEGTTSEQGKDDAARPLTHEECQSLGQSIVDACNGTNTRSAQFEGWCSDVVQGVDTGSWIADCEKHIRYMDAVCFTSNPAIRAMMDCDAAVQR